MIGETVQSMRDLTACIMRATSPSNEEACYSGIKTMLRNANGIAHYWANKVNASGGVESTTNRLEQIKLRDAEWVLLGT